MVKIKKYCDRCSHIKESRYRQSDNKSVLRRAYIKQNIKTGIKYKVKWNTIGWYCPRCHYFEPDTTIINTEAELISKQITQKEWQEYRVKGILTSIEKIEQSNGTSIDSILYQEKLKEYIESFSGWMSFPLKVSEALEIIKDDNKFTEIMHIVDKIREVQKAKEKAQHEAYESFQKRHL